MKAECSGSAYGTARVGAVDLTKSFAILFVLLIHASSDVLRYSPVGGAGWLCGLFWGSISRGAVPLFLLCSGALLLDPGRALSIRHIWRRNILHLLLALFFWAGIYKSLGLLTAGNVDGGSVRGAVWEWLLWQHEGHLYYLPVILLVYAALPVTRALCARADRSTLRYALAFWAVFGVLLPTLQSFGALKKFGGIVRQWPLPMAWSAIGCSVLGEALRRWPCSVRQCAGVFVAGFAICFAGTWALSVRAGTLKTPLLEGFSPGPCMMAAGLFSLCVCGEKRIPERWMRRARQLSGGSFCIYLVHIALLRGLLSLGLGTGRFPGVTIPVLALLCGALSWAVYLLLSHLPWVRRWLI